MNLTKNEEWINLVNNKSNKELIWIKKEEEWKEEKWVIISRKNYTNLFVSNGKRNN